MQALVSAFPALPGKAAPEAQPAVAPLWHGSQLRQGGSLSPGEPRTYGVVAWLPFVAISPAVAQPHRYRCGLPYSFPTSPRDNPRGRGLGSLRKEGMADWGQMDRETGRAEASGLSGDSAEGILTHCCPNMKDTVRNGAGVAQTLRVSGGSDLPLKASARGAQCWRSPQAVGGAPGLGCLLPEVTQAFLSFTSLPCPYIAIIQQQEFQGKATQSH